jgi:hypothetical protein
MTLRQPLLTAALAIGLLAGCSRNATPPQPAESGGTPAPQMEAPPSDKPAQAPADTQPTQAMPTGEMPSGGTAAADTGKPPDKGPAVFFVRNSGVRCIAAPCPTFNATRPDRPGDEPLPVTDLDFSALNISDEKRANLEMATFNEPGLKVKARVETVPNAGPAGAATVLRVSEVIEK